MITIASMITHVLSFRGFYGNKQAKHRKVLDMNDSSMKETMVYKDSNGAIHIAEREGPNCAWGEFKVVTGRPTHKIMRLISSYGDGNMLLKKEYDEPGKTIAKNSHRHRKQPRMHRNDY
ncbi:hypothetical protein HERIO_2658 [Hepatospora eriocheir]|uniref:Uncharacterized protein n=1 Tax=Hepatospora eriocheir TaxID=1081669 RepID=A0A1X0Q5F6_9MICR|nr:hypothetical protein HERIO_2658 [Hepatospora eriocheir]